MVWTNHKPSNKDAYKAMCIEEILSLLDVYKVLTRGRSFASHLKNRNNSSNQCMEHSCTCGAMCIKEYIKFVNVCFANSASIKKERGMNFWGILDFLPN